MRRKIKIIISPAKKMNIRPDLIPVGEMPVLLEQTEQLKEYFQSLSYQQAKEVWKCNDSIAELNYRRFQEMNLYRDLTPAVLAYEGLQYQHMAPSVFEDRQWMYLKEHLRILSGFYGILAPCDGVVPYRLEMQAKIGIEMSYGIETSLYKYWGDRIYRELTGDTDIIVNLASKEYSKVVESYLDEEIKYITCVFGEQVQDKNGNKKVKTKGTIAKILRGEMVRYMAEREIEDISAIKDFSFDGYRFCEEMSSDRELIFCNLAIKSKQ